MVALYGYTLIYAGLNVYNHCIRKLALFIHIEQIFQKKGLKMIDVTNTLCCMGSENIIYIYLWHETILRSTEWCIIFRITSHQTSIEIIHIRLSFYDHGFAFYCRFYEASLNSHLYSSGKQFDAIMYNSLYITTGTSWLINFLESIWMWRWGCEEKRVW